MFPTTLLTTLLLALSVAANPVQLDRPLVTLPISRRLNLTSVHNLVRHDQARAKALKLRGSNVAGNSRAVVNEAIDNQAVTYVATVSVGSPATTCELAFVDFPKPFADTSLIDSLLIDTGSSNTWVGAGKAYVKTSTSVQTANRVVS
jgi:cathepsin E